VDNRSITSRSASAPIATKQEPKKVTIQRSGHMGISFTLTNINEPDPDGDVVLVVSPPKGPRAYNAEGNAALSNFTVPQTTRFRVSSRHLILASPYFQGRLGSQWPEGKELKSKGSVELEIPDTDPETLLILLNIIHARTTRVPLLVTVNQLTELAIMTDYFQCHDAVGVYSNMWKESLKTQIPTKYSPAILKWILISWVFGYPDVFTSVTQTAQLQTTSSIWAMDLPIPANIQGETWVPPKTYCEC
jgi:hypothetical protein